MAAMEEYAGRFNQGIAEGHARRKCIGPRLWLVISESGESHAEEVERHSIMRRTGLPARDLRALDPVLSYPSSILGRERAIVINLEHIKAIVTAKEVLLVNSSNPLVVQFIEDLKERIVGSTRQQEEMGKGSDQAKSGDDSVSSHGYYGSHVEDVKMPEGVAPKLLPFEFRALEACLESACRCLESETATLEEEAYPALDELTAKISTLNLERVRHIKSRMVAISGRVQKVRNELEHLLDDDNDMGEMYLTEKLCSRSTDRSVTNRVDEEDNALTNEDLGDSGVDMSENHSEDSLSFKPDISELEMLLEAYFAQTEGTLQKLSHMSEYVDDTEDYINIMLDDKQNQLLHMSVNLNALNMFLNAGIVVVGLFGMNIHIPLYDADPIKFWQTAYGTVAGIAGLYAIAFTWGKRRYQVA